MKYRNLLHSPMISSKITPVIEKAGQIEAPVLILGEPGTGKELVAKIIHHTSDRKDQPFHKLDCRFLGDEGFSDEVARFLQEADETELPVTLYLKEVGFLEAASQLRLLQLMEEGVFDKGMPRPLARIPKIISSSSEDLERKVLAGKFLEELYDRLAPLSIRIPSLRDRVEEIASLARYLLAEYSQRMKIKPVDITDEALALLKGYWWPGNLREFERVLIRSAIFAEGEKLTDRNLFIEVDQVSSFSSFLKKVEGRPSPVREKVAEEPKGPPLPVFFIELVHRVKNPLVSIKTFTQLLREKFNDSEFREYFYRIVTEDIERIDELLDGLLYYVKVSTPMKKMNTVHTILEEIFQRHEKQLEEKHIRIYKKFEKDLPETILHDEHLRYILNALLQYALPSIPPAGSIGFLTRSLDPLRRADENETVAEKNGRWIEILIVYTGYRKWVESFESPPRPSPTDQERRIELELRLVREMIQKNQGTMKFAVNEKSSRTSIFLRFPVERREVVYYPPASA
jgi:hypothetical protein